jgi:hypothetical protein
MKRNVNKILKIAIVLAVLFAGAVSMAAPTVSTKTPPLNTLSKPGWGG